MHKAELAELVGRSLRAMKVDGISFLVPDARYIYEENDYWHVPIMPSQELKSLFPAMEELARVEGAIADEYHLRLVLHLTEATFGQGAERNEALVA
ncbi:hypothetical protein [Armatimonas sp.]|uniref:hypothetical protein n=1 Tax=Armatimonas sp. TaxID=1872638 RepID=UPI00286CF2FD|nr:hypothetical protein [Armatimonas sp.]